MTPLHVACKRNHIKVVQLLLNYGTPVDATTTVRQSLNAPPYLYRPCVKCQSRYLTPLRAARKQSFYCSTDEEISSVEICSAAVWNACFSWVTASPVSTSVFHFPVSFNFLKEIQRDFLPDFNRKFLHQCPSSIIFLII